MRSTGHSSYGFSRVLFPEHGLLSLGAFTTLPARTGHQRYHSTPGPKFGVDEGAPFRPISPSDASSDLCRRSFGGSSHKILENRYKAFGI